MQGACSRNGIFLLDHGALRQIPYLFPGIMYPDLHPEL